MGQPLEQQRLHQRAVASLYITSSNIGESLGVRLTGWSK